ncbi:MICOS complex subunit MIC27 [Episyrphus balteatus]|uniref:MICOS complex subunit MIC27 n=1 Tax=Episyrphus balteatus TaxID=286459 RepID=UPI00248523ED|nr:MICOS complex subunit MIC27 [Episyrphus balteatus]XP_055856547.1 MICOS complex subunit MIC27 [Episyrphus balteatus]
MFTKLVYGAAAPMLAAVAVKSAESPKPTSSTENDLAYYKCKPSELPVYAPLHSLNKPKPPAHPPKDSKVRETLESGVRAVRVEVTSAYKAVAQQKKNVEGIIATGVAHSQSTIDYLNEPDNTMPRVGAIAIGGVAGLILAVRGGFFKKIIYTGIGAGGIASLCYPKEAEKFAQQGLIETRKGYVIAYNFVKGIKPGDEIGVEPISNFPTSVAELKDLFADLVDSAKGAIFSSKK